MFIHVKSQLREKNTVHPITIFPSLALPRTVIILFYNTLLSDSLSIIKLRDQSTDTQTYMFPEILRKSQKDGRTTIA